MVFSYRPNGILISYPFVRHYLMVFSYDPTEKFISYAFNTNEEVMSEYRASNMQFIR